MTLYAQHGYGKSDKIQKAMEFGIIDGVVFSPRDEAPERLSESIRSIADSWPESELMIDPQFHLLTIETLKARRLPDYDYYQSMLNRADFVDSPKVEAYSRAVIEWQRSLPVCHLVAPTVLFQDFQDAWKSQTALQMASASARFHSAGSDLVKPLLLSFVFDESALAALDRLKEFLNIITGLKPSGFYIVVNRAQSRYKARMKPDLLQNLLYMTYVLAELNGFDVILGYTDLIGILAHAVGAKATACGWSLALRQFSEENFKKREGGQRALERYTSIPLLNVILRSELNDALDKKLGHKVLTRTPFDEQFLQNPKDDSHWHSTAMALRHWAALKMAVEDVVAEEGVGNRLSRVMQMISSAKQLYEELRRAGISLCQTSTGRHLGDWEKAIKGFAQTFKISLSR